MGPSPSLKPSNPRQVTDRGLEVLSVDPQGQAAASGVVRGALIVEVAGEPLPDVARDKLQVGARARAEGQGRGLGWAQDGP